MDEGELNTALEALKETLPDGGPISLEEADLRAREFGETLDDLDGFSECHPVGTAFRALGIVASLQGAVSSRITAYTDPNFENVTRALLDDLGVARDAAQFADEPGLVADDGFIAGFGSNKIFGKLLGVAGIAFTVVGLSRSVFGDDRNLADAAIGTLNFTAGVLGVPGVGGPAGAAIALGALALQSGLNHYRKAYASNDYTGQVAANFIEPAGFTPEAADSLTNRCGDGHY